MFTQILLYAAIAVAVITIGQWAGKLLFTGKKNLTVSRKAAQSLSITLRDLGFKRIPEMLEAFAVGELEDLFTGLHDLATVVRSGNETILKELDGTFERVLGVKLSSPEGRAVLRARLVEAEKNALEVAKVVAPIALAIL